MVAESFWLDAVHSSSNFPCADYNRAILVGARTFGKGTFQEGEVWNKNTKISLFRTQGFYLLPSGMSPQLKGIIPDIVQKENDTATTTLREEITYFNPIASNHALDVERNEASKQKKLSAEFKKCLPTMNFTKDDKTLKLGLEVLSCHRISSLIATQFSADEIN